MGTVHLVNEPNMIRQGDVLVMPVTRPVNDEDIGELIKDSDKSRIVLAYGEANGHAHAFYPKLDLQEKKSNKAINEIQEVENPAQLFELNHTRSYSLSTLPDQKLLRLNTRALLRHEEHDIISLPAGDYVVVRQHEGDEIKEIRRVAD